jgi:Flp pilus assembly protein TadD
LEVNPQQAEAESDLGLAYLQTGDRTNAVEHLGKAVALVAGNAKAHANLATALMAEGRAADAIVHYQKALDLQPHYLEAEGGLAWALATAPEALVRNGARAVELAQEANTLAHENNPLVMRILAAAYAEDNRFAEAIDTAQQALTLANSQRNGALAGVLEKELALYHAGLPFHNVPRAVKSN